MQQLNHWPMQAKQNVHKCANGKGGSDKTVARLGRHRTQIQSLTAFDALVN